MLNVEVPFPHPGAQAFWQGQRYKIVQRMLDGDVTISGDRGTRRVALDELTDPKHLKATPFGRWLVARTRMVASHQIEKFTPASVLRDDYRAWLIATQDARGASENGDCRGRFEPAIAIGDFEAMLSRNGLARETIAHLQIGQAEPAHVPGFNLRLITPFVS
jgi:hypothetical protein